MASHEAESAAPKRRGGALTRFSAWFRDAASRFGAGLEDYYSSNYRRSFRRLQRDQDDLFMMMVLSEALGVPNPASYYTMEMLPVVYENFHEWHKRMGMERSPLEEISCC